MPDDLRAAEVRRVAALARLALTPDEVDLYTRQLGRILDYARQIGELDTRDVPATLNVLEQPPVERPDDPRPSLDRAAVLSNAPDPAGGLFRVPKVLGEP
jgi:aspartyl-tRNA(Asn)/glutamyl-tRNA(Gln) amidotransferase subunit C